MRLQMCQACMGAVTLRMQEPVVEAVAVQLPAGRVVDTGFYQDGRLAVLLQRQGSSAGGGAGASLMLLPLQAAPDPLPAEQRDGDILQVNPRH